jgi:hypothetical protein
MVRAWALQDDWLYGLHIGCEELTGHADLFRHPFKTLRVFLYLLQVQGYPRPGVRLELQAQLCYQRLEEQVYDELEGNKPPFNFAGERIPLIALPNTLL